MTTFIVPDNAVVDDQKIITEYSMIIGNHSIIERDLQTGFLMVGEGVRVSGEIHSDDDIRADVWCKFEKNVTANGDAYIGEFTVIDGKIVVEGDLDIGKEVKLNGGFLSKGWVVVRNPLPVMVFIFLYIRALIGLGKTSEEIDKALNEMFEDDEEIDFENLDENKITEILNRGGFFVIPLGSKISSESINVPDNAVIGDNCTIQTRIICKNFEAGQNLVFDGVIRSKGETILADNSKISGELNSSGKLIIGKNVTIKGNISAKSVLIHETSFVEGKISSGNIRFAVGDDFDVKDPTNAEKAQILSKADSFEKIKTNVIEPKEEQIEEEQAGENQFDDEIELPDENSAETEEASTESEKIEDECDCEQEQNCINEPETEDAPENESAPDMEISNENDVDDSNIEVKAAGEAKSESRRAQRRKNKKSNAQNIPIVDVFTGENIESAKENSSEEENKEKNSDEASEQISSEQTNAEK